MNISASKMIRYFSRSEKGSVALPFAVLAIPMVAFSGIAVDYSQAVAVRKQLQNIADSTVIAGARLPATTNEKRLEDARHMLNAALANAKLDGARVNIEASNANVKIDINYTYKTNLMGILGVETMNLDVVSAAQSQVENGGVACLLALNETTDDGLHLQGINKVSSRNCWSWVNSDSATAINANGTSMGTGQGFCSHGGAVGAEHFSPPPFTECDKLDDPFADRFTYDPAAGRECQHTNLDLKSGTYVLEPGVYCGNTTLRPQAVVTMLPGLYIMKGGILEVQGQATLQGEDVTLYFDGNNSQLIVRGGGNFEIKAPSDGEYAGFVIVEPNPINTSVREAIIQGGGRLKIEGILYAPKWLMNISGNGDMNQDSKYFAMIADHFYMEGNGSLYIQSDAAGANLPDLMPRIKSGPRLLY